MNVPHVPKPKPAKFLVKAILCREQKADHNSLDMESTGRNVRNKVTTMSTRMHTRSIDNFLCSDTVKERSAECSGDKNFIHLHTRMMKNLENINTLLIEKPNKRTLQRS